MNRGRDSGFVAVVITGLGPLTIQFFCFISYTINIIYPDEGRCRRAISYGTPHVRCVSCVPRKRRSTLPNKRLPANHAPCTPNALLSHLLFCEWLCIPPTYFFLPRLPLFAFYLMVLNIICNIDHSIIVICDSYIIQLISFTASA